MATYTCNRTFRNRLGPVLLSLLLGACGGGGGGGGGGTGGLSTGDGDGGGSGSGGIAGTWTVISQVNGTQCGEGTYTETQSLDIERSGSSLTVTDSDGNVFTGSVDGNNVQWSGSFPEDDGTTTLNLSATLDADGTGFSGSSNFTYRSDDGSIVCDGSSTFEGTLVSSGGSGGGDGDGPVGGSGGAVTLGALTEDWPFYLGGTEDDYGTAVAVDSTGNILVGGIAGSETFTWPGTGDLRSSFGFFRNTYVIKYSSTGEPIWATLVDTGAYLIGMAVDSAGNVLVQGASTVTKLSAAGERLWSVDFSDQWGLAPFANATGNASLETVSRSRIAVNMLDQVIVSGTTSEADAASGGFETTRPGRQSAFVAKLSPNGDMLWSTYLGSPGRDTDTGLTLNGLGTIFVTGTTDHLDWPPSPVDDNMPDEATRINGSTCFVASLSTAGEFAWSTFIGGGMGEFPTISEGTIVLDDLCTAIEHDRSGTLTVTGSTASLGSGFSGWVSGGYRTSPSALSSVDDGFVLQMPDTGASITWSTYFGDGDGTTEGLAIASRGVPGTYIAGMTESEGWGSSSDSVYKGGRDGFLLKLSAVGGFEFAAHMGGTEADEARALALDLAANPIVTGFTGSQIWPLGAPDLTSGQDADYQGATDAFIVRSLPE